MRGVIDTNVLVAGLLWNGPAHQVLGAVRSGRLTAVTSAALLEELDAVLRRPKFAAPLRASGLAIDALVANVARISIIMEHPPLERSVSRDPDDDRILALALAAKVDLVITGDGDLLVLESFAGIPIITPGAALSRIPF